MNLRKKNRKRSQSFDDHPITALVNPIINKQSKIVTIGSCFALEVRKWLTSNGYNAFSESKYELIWYNTYTILAELERVAETWEQDEDDVWHLEDGRWQDPYRRCVFADSKEQLLSDIDNLNRAIGQAIRETDILIITLGLTEVFVRPSTDRVICASPGYSGGGGQECWFRASNYSDNYENICRTIDLLYNVNRKCKVILTVSPVPFFSTFREMDHIVANTASKSILRAVADEITRKYLNVHYFHSYEMVVGENRKDVYKADGRHVKPEYVAKIMEQFERIFMQ